MGNRSPLTRKMKAPRPGEAPSCPGCLRLKGPSCPLSARNRGAADCRREVSRRDLFSQGAAALLPPALGFAAGFALAGRLFPLSGEEVRAAAGLVLMFLTASGVCLFRRRSPVKS
jgi:hypothetical protein